MFEQMLRKSALKVTPQRLAILRELQHFGHASIEQLHAQIRPKHPFISLATIYKNLSSLQDAHIIEEVRLPARKPHYELAKERHLHLLCSSCGEICDFFAPGELSALQAACATKSGYQVADVAVTLTGLCPKCAK